MAAGWLVYKQLPSTIEAAEKDFAVKDAKNITGFRLTSTEHSSMTLTLDSGTWMINHTHQARQDLVSELLEAATRVTSLSPVPFRAHDNVIKSMLGKNVKVEVYCGNNEPEKIYYVGGPTIDSKGTYMLLEVDGKMAKRPHIMYVPGFTGYLTPRFNPDTNVWRSRSLFNVPTDDIDELNVTYTQSPEKSFVIKRLAKDSFEINTADTKYRVYEKPSSKAILQYLSFYNNINIESFENENPERDSVLMQTPFCLISVSLTNGKTLDANLYYMPRNKRSKLQFDSKGEPLAYDIDHYYATIHQGRDFVMVQHYTLGKILRAYREFFFKPEQSSQK